MLLSEARARVDHECSYDNSNSTAGAVQAEANLQEQFGGHLHLETKMLLERQVPKVVSHVYASSDRFRDITMWKLLTLKK